MTKVLLLCPERVRPTMAGVGIRFLEMARSLSRGLEVTLGVPNEPGDLPGAGVRLARYDAANIAELCRDADAVVLHGHVSNLYFAHGVARPLVVDLYDPFPIENLSYFPTLGDAPYRHDRATLEQQLRHGDFFLCSSDEQRLFYLGMLFTLGRFNPETYFDDFVLANLVRVAPFGVPAEEPTPDAPVLRGVVPGIGADDPVILFGGIYDWYDPMLLIRALPALIDRFAGIRVVFCANPNPESTPQGAYAEVLAACREKRWIDRHVFFIPWVPYPQRAGLYLESTVAAVLHRPRFETEISMRTRILEHLWTGLPTVATAGGGMSRQLADREMGLVVPEGDPAALIDALSNLLSTPQLRRQIADSGRSWAADHTWERVMEPLSDFLAEPRPDPHKLRYSAASPAVKSVRGIAGSIARRWLSPLLSRRAR